MITESVNRPDRLAFSLPIFTVTLLGSPARSMLLVTIIRGRSEPRLAGAVHRRQPSPGDPNPLQMEPAGAADPPPEITVACEPSASGSDFTNAIMAQTGAGPSEGAGVRFVRNLFRPRQYNP